MESYIFIERRCNYANFYGHFWTSNRYSLIRFDFTDNREKSHRSTTVSVDELVLTSLELLLPGMNDTQLYVYANVFGIRAFQWLWLRRFADVNPYRSHVNQSATGMPTTYRGIDRNWQCLSILPTSLMIATVRFPWWSTLELTIFFWFSGYCFTPKRPNVRTRIRWMKFPKFLQNVATRFIKQKNTHELLLIHY